MVKLQGVKKMKFGDELAIWFEFFLILFNLLSFRLGDITLGDFKEAIDRPGMFRYHFKALDPEFGTVKEEV